MIEYVKGSLVKSLAGHDKGNLFIIIDESKEYVTLVDGKIRTLERAKKKKKKHVQIVHYKDETLSKKLMYGEHVTNEEFRSLIKCYKREGQVI